jgi:fatty-acid O-methyltransferase
MFSIWKRYLPQHMKRRAMVSWYDMLARIDTKGELLFFNHGYATPGETAHTIELVPELEQHRYAIQLYNLLAHTQDWKDKDGLEVSCGLGGGMMFVDSQYGPRSMTGLDISTSSIDACRRRYMSKKLHFEAGDAQAMPFCDQSFDIVINVESSLNYPDFPVFLREVDRVLRPGGTLLFADYRRTPKIAKLQRKLKETGYTVEVMNDITAGILRGLELNRNYKQNMIEKYVPYMLRGIARGFAGLSGEKDEEHHKFRSGEKSYLMAVLRKPAASTTLGLPLQQSG